MPNQNQALIEKNIIHRKLVKRLKEALILGQLAWLQAGKYLYQIRKDKTYRTEDLTHKITFLEFCGKPEIPLSGRNDASRLRIAETLIRVYKFWILEKNINVNKLSAIGYTKLALLVSVVKTREKETEDWLKKATLLTTSDLYKEIKQKDKSFDETLNCLHKNIKVVTFFECEDCHARFKLDPRKDKINLLKSI